LEAVKAFRASLEEKPKALDLGCGDFNIGSHLREFCGGYIACDIVEPPIAFNKKKYAALNVDFRVLDLSVDPLPPADAIFVRHVFQHLSNAEILACLDQISANYKYFVLTEHAPRKRVSPPTSTSPQAATTASPFTAGSSSPSLLLI